MKKSNDKKTVIIILVIFALVVGAYVARSIYLNNTGELVGEYIFKVSEKQSVNVDGFVIRDEYRFKDGENVSILKKKDDYVYVPTVSDSSSVAQGDTIAIAFKSSTQAESYKRSKELEAKIEYLEHLTDQGNLSYINVLTLNSEINSTVAKYMDVVDSGNLSEIDEVIKKFNYKITSKQIATGKEPNIQSQLKAYKKEKKSNDKLISGITNIETSTAGYFVSNVDGFENAYSYKDISKGKISTKQVKKLLKKTAKAPDDTYGKIIGEHTWYFVCNMTFKSSSDMRTGYYVYVDFPEKGIYDLPMIVHHISERTGKNVTVTLRCTVMNEKLSSLRKEKAEITIQTFNGYKVKNEALSTNDSGFTGVYVLSGKRIIFKPVRIIHSGDGYSIIGRYAVFDKEGNINEAESSKYPKIKEYDYVIVKGRNLENGKVVN